MTPSAGTCAPAATQCGTLGAHMRSCCDAVWHPQRADALLLRRSVAPSARTCAPTATQCGTLGAHVRSCCDAMWHPRRAHALLVRRNVAPPERTCAHAAANVTLRPLHALPLDKSSQPDLTFDYKVEDRRTSDFGGCRRYGLCWIAQIGPVPARELSLLLLPRAPEVCTHVGKTSTGRIGVAGTSSRWPLALVDES